MREIGYSRSLALAYARRWALSRNPDYYDFADVGGDCTSFISQCIYAGTGVMNYTPTYGWYYISGNDKSPAWSGVNYFFNFMTTNEGIGPYGTETDLTGIVPGDVIQLGTDRGQFYHTLLLVDVRRVRGRLRYYIAAHNNDAYMRPLDSYSYGSIRFIHILGARAE